MQPPDEQHINLIEEAKAAIVLPLSIFIEFVIQQNTVVFYKN